MANTKVTGDLIASSTIATGNIADNAVTSDKISGITTAHITEGSNLYYTNARARGAVSVSGNALSYNSSTGVITSNFEESPAFTGNVDVAGNITVGGNDSILAENNLRFKSSGAAYIDHNTTGQAINFRTSNSSSLDTNAMTILGSGNVGIGTNTPVALLHLKQAAGANIRFENGTTSRVFTVGEGVGTNDVFSFRGNSYRSTDTLSVDFSTDRVGIGTITPGSKLEVITSGANSVVELDNSNTNYTLIQYNASGATKGFSGFNAGFMLFGGEAGTTTRLQSGGAYAATILENGNFGIGTTSPNYRLEVRTTNNTRAIQAVNSTTSGTNWGFQGGAYGSGATKNIGLQVTAEGASTNYAALFEGGNVGIGTTSPTAKLEIVGSNGTNIFRGNFAGSADIFMGFDNANPYLVLQDNSNVTTHLFQSNVNNYIVGSNVGIGMTSPNAKLEIKGTGATSGLAFKTTDSSSNETFYIKDGGTVGVRYYPFKIGVTSGTANVPNTRLQIATTGGDFVVLNDGKTGIGVADPQAKLEVKGPSASPADGNEVIAVTNTTGGSKLLLGVVENAYGWIQSAEGGTLRNLLLNPSGGNVGIGTTAPAAKLHVENTNAAIVYVKSTINNQNASIWFNSNSGGTQADRWEIGTNISAGTDLEFFDRLNSVSRMVIQNDGNVGIGTISPTRKLDIAGEITHEGLVPKAGAFVDGLVTINKTVSTTANTWTSLDISLSNIGGSGTFAVQVYSDAHGSTGGAWYGMYWSGMMSWYHSNVNATDIDEIPLHAAGHAMNGSTLELRTKLHTADGTSYANRCELQIKTSSALTSAPISFRFRKLL